MGSHTTGKYRASAAVSVGDEWKNAANIYDTNESTYAVRDSYATSATHINGFGINNLPSNAVVDSVEIHSKLYAENTYGYIYVYVYTDEGPTAIKAKSVVNGAKLSEQYVTQIYTLSEIKSELDSKGVCNGDIIQFLKTLRIRFVIGSTGKNLLFPCECRVYDNYVVVNYTIPDYLLTVNATAGGTVSGGGTYESGKTAKLTATPSSGYKFVKWSDGNTSATRTVTVTENATYTAQFEKITYTATFKNYDGTILQTVIVEHGSSPSYTGSMPTKAQDAQYDYSFNGWSPSLGAITSDTTYIAQFTAIKRSYNITTSVSPLGSGSITGGGTYEYGTVKTLVATGNSGYKFVKWSDGTTTASRSITVTGAATYTAVFEPIYVTFDSIFNFRKWKSNGITGSNSVVSDISDIGITLTSNSGVSEGTVSSPYFPVEAGKSYKIDVDTIGDGWDVYIFFHSATSTGTGLEFSDGTNRFSSNGSGNATRIFTAPDGAVKAQIRVDANGSDNTVTFCNFRIYPADCEYMSTTVAAEDRSNAISWNIPIPVRNGYEFLGWNTEPDGSGTAYTSDSSFPTDDLTLYSQWKALSLPEFSSVLITPNPCDAGQGFIISVAFTE